MTIGPKLCDCCCCCIMLGIGRYWAPVCTNGCCGADWCATGCCGPLTRWAGGPAEAAGAFDTNAAASGFSEGFMELISPLNDVAFAPAFCFVFGPLLFKVY
jgi:hypothetical protein